jgi:hypothetical protein
MIQLMDILRESINDRYTFKSIFLAGGPGSGKSFIGKQMFGNEFFGAKTIACDIFVEFLLKRENLPLTFDPSKDVYQLQMQQRERARRLTQNQMFNSIDACLPVLVDGTGHNYAKVTKTAAKLKEIGYDTSMVFVNTSLEVAKQRNQARERTLSDDVVVSLWKETQENLGKYQSFFSNKDFIIIDNSTTYKTDSEEYKQLNLKLYKAGQRILSSPLENPIGKIIVKEMRSQGVKYLHELKLNRDIISMIHTLRP